MTNFEATITNVKTGETLASSEIAPTGKLQSNWEALVAWAEKQGHQVEVRFGTSLSGKAGDGILVDMTKVYREEETEE